MTTFNLRQLAYTGGVFSFLFFFIWWLSVWFFPGREVHLKLLMEMLPTNVWPLSLGVWLYAAVGSLVCGALAAVMFGLIFNYFGTKK